MNAIIQERINIIPSIEVLQAAAQEQIRVLIEQKSSLENISTDLSDLIQRYNAQKSYLGHAAYWYGEQEWWVKIVVSTLAAAVTNLLLLPAILSMALSLVASFLLQNHYQVSKERDQMICKDLQEQNDSVQVSLLLLNTTKENLEQSLQTLCQMNIDMGKENIKLRENITTLTLQADQYKSTTNQLQSTIHELQSKEHTLSYQISIIEAQLRNYAKMLEEGTLQFTTANNDFRTATDALTISADQLRTVTSQFSMDTEECSRTLEALHRVTNDTTASSPTTPENNARSHEHEEDVLKNAQLVSQQHSDFALDKQLNSLKTPPRAHPENIPKPHKKR